ncbi:type II toxin-antitoxin system VapC family toxin [Moorella sp. ACPs]|uniref:type II toxin-antitoxin system VapC family toxin n=1 Tax=Neomoorella carbonis TaxID=3062783 RepID=UPI0032465968
MTLLELLVKPKSLGLEEVCEQYITTLKSYPNLQLIDFNLEIAVLGAEIRVKYRVRTPDAIQLAFALASDATLFFTNDLQFRGRAFANILKK